MTNLIVDHSSLFYSSFFQFVISLILIVFLLHFISKVFLPTESRKYRQILGDLFVAGKIKLLAKEDNIDIAEEFEDYKSFWKKGAMLSSENLDDAIELDLIDRISEEVLKSKKAKDKKDK